MKIFYTLIILMIFTNSALAETTIYKCKDKRGKIAYVNNPKSEECQKTDLIEQGKQTVLTKKFPDSEKSSINLEEAIKPRKNNPNEQMIMKIPDQTKSNNVNQYLQEMIKRIEERNIEMEKTLAP